MNLLDGHSLRELAEGNRRIVATEAQVLRDGNLDLGHVNALVDCVVQVALRVGSDVVDGGRDVACLEHFACDDSFDAASSPQGMARRALGARHLELLSACTGVEDIGFRLVLDTLSFLEPVRGEWYIIVYPQY